MQQLTIANGTSLSGPINLKPDYLGAILMPSAWTAAVLSLEGSMDGTNFFACHDAAGEALSLVTAVDRVIVLAPEATKEIGRAHV